MWSSVEHSKVTSNFSIVKLSEAETSEVELSNILSVLSSVELSGAVFSIA